MLYEQISLRRDEFRLKSANYILVKMSKIHDRAQIQPFHTSCALGQIFLCQCECTCSIKTSGVKNMQVVTPQEN